MFANGFSASRASSSSALSREISSKHAWSNGRQSAFCPCPMVGSVQWHLESSETVPQFAHQAFFSSQQKTGSESIFLNHQCLGYLLILASPQFHPSSF